MPDTRFLLLLAGFASITPIGWTVISWLERRNGMRKTILRHRVQVRVDGRWIDRPPTSGATDAH